MSKREREKRESRERERAKRESRERERDFFNQRYTFDTWIDGSEGVSPLPDRNSKIDLPHIVRILYR